MYSGRSKYSKQDKLKEIYPETYYNQIDKRERQRGPRKQQKSSDFSQKKYISKIKS